MKRWWFYAIVGLIGTILLAFVLRRVVQDYVILPLAKLIWYLRTFYYSVPQVVFWVLLLVVLVFMTIGSFSFRAVGTHNRRQTNLFRLGDVRQLSFWIQRSRRGVYSKWHVAHTLAELALDILQRWKGSLKREQQLAGPGWEPPVEVQAYLEAALKTTYVDYPRRHLFDFNPHTPFDHDLESTISYLESLMENDDDHQHS